MAKVLIACEYSGTVRDAFRQGEVMKTMNCLPWVVPVVALIGLVVTAYNVGVAAGMRRQALIHNLASEKVIRVQLPVDPRLARQTMEMMADFMARAEEVLRHEEGGTDQPQASHE